MHNPLAIAAIHGAITHLEHSLTVVELGHQRVPGSESAKDWFKSIGFSTYVAIDVNTRKSAIAMDLNKILVDEYDYTETFDLVTNNGTGEHIFNQAVLFENAHNLCNVGGCMLHLLTFTPWLNHGFYNYNPILVQDLAAINGYEICFLWIGERGGDYQDLELFSDDELQMLVDSFDGENLLIAVCLRKTSDSKFRAPMQKKYLTSIKPDAMRREYDPQSTS